MTMAGKICGIVGVCVGICVDVIYLIQIIVVMGRMSSM
jgi:hypothetical protein